MTPQEFSKTIKAKYPQYKNVDDLELAKKIIEKYPVYSSKVDFTGKNLDNTKNIVSKADVVANVANISEKGLNIGANILKGVVKGAGSTIVGAGKLGTNLMSKIPVIGGGEKAVKGVNEMVTGLKEEILKPEGTAQKVGFLGEQLGEFLIPGGATMKLGKMAEIASGGSKLAKLGATAFGEGFLGAGQTVLQKGGIDKEAGVVGTIGAVTPVGLKVAGSVLKTVGKAGSEVLGMTTGAGKEAISEAFKNPNVMKLARKANIDMATFQDDMLSSLKNGFSNIKQERSKNYLSQLEKIKLDTNQYDNIVSEIRDTAKNTLGEFKVSIKPPSDTSVGNKLNELDFSKSTITGANEKVSNAWNDLMGWSDNSVTGLDTLKQRLFDYASQSENSPKSKAFIMKLAGGVDKGLKDSVKGYKDMTSSYAGASTLIDEIDNAFKPGGNKETAIKKILTSLKQDNEIRKELLNTIGGGELVAKAAATQLNSRMPRKLFGSMVGGTALTGIVLNPGLWPALLTAAFSASPKYMGDLASTLGKIDKAMITNKTIPNDIIKSVREIIVKTYNNE